jgi:dTDP-4-dehydrorhamnose 3,5-epimerase
MFDIEQTNVLGVRLIRPRIHSDTRGEFIKTFHEGFFSANGIDFCPREQFFSISKKSVLRGLHFQRPPADLAKLVFCVSGRIRDVVVDLRASGNPGEVYSCELTATGREMLFIPKGCAHGFLALEDAATVFYLTDAVYDAENDDGILWNSINFDWGISNPIVSPRDARLKRIEELDSLFV